MPDRATIPSPAQTTEGAVAHEWTLLLILAGVQFTHMMDFMVMMPLGPQFMRLLRLSPAQFGWLVSIYTFSASLCGFIAALYIDRFDRKHTVLFLYGGLTLSTLLCALAPGFSMLLAARAMAGAFGGILSATVFSIIGDVIPEQRRATATGTVMMAFSVSAILGVPTGLYLANHFSWRAPFFLLSALGIIFLAIASRVLPALRSHMDHHHEPHLIKQLHAIFSVPRHLNAFALIATLMFAGFSVIPYISPYLVANAGLPESDLPILYLCGGLVTLLSSRSIGRLADHWGKREVFIGVAALSIAPILVVTHIAHASLLMAVVVMIFLMVLVSGRMVPAIALITSSAEPRLRGSFMNFNSSIQQLSAGLAAAGAGAIIGKMPGGALTHYDRVGLLATLCTLISIALAWRLGRHAPAAGSL
jgi:predicted MFS family arabinose efflux permease